ncbi:MAG: tetratricopeptide repeat protein [Planctomycetaceae bacterium]
MNLARQLPLLALVLLALSGCDRAEKKQEVVKLKSAPKVDLDQVYSVGDYKKAIPLLQEHLKTHYSDGRNWFRLGYALHSENRLREAISAHEQAASYDSSQAPTAIYNCACAFALLNEPEEALERLRIAVESGFNRVEIVREDPDLDSIRDLEAFRQIVDSINKPRRDERMSSRTELDFWIGDWDLEDRAGDKPIRTMVLQKQNGYVLTESWRGEDDQAGTVVTFFDPREGKWKQNRIDNDGAIVYYTGEVEDGVVKFAGDFVNVDGSAGQRRITMAPDESEQMVDYVVEESVDDGDTWSVTFRGRWVRRKPRLAE